MSARSAKSAAPTATASAAGEVPPPDAAGPSAPFGAPGRTVAEGGGGRARPATGSEAPAMPEAAAELLASLSEGEARVAVVGLGYVGLPLAVAAADAGFRTIGFDVDPEKVDALNAGRSYIDAVPDETVSSLRADNRFVAVSSPDRLASADVVCICVPTPLGPHREPDLAFVERTADMLAEVVRPGQLVVLESTSFPGTTREVVRPRLARTGLALGEELFLAYSPEREDPGNAAFSTRRIPKVVAGDDPAAAALAEAFYGRIVERVVRVSSTPVAEAVKITENVFRAVNIALVNELKLAFEAMGIDVWEVIDAASTKPFGYMPFYPGPGLGGHCIPVDPFYLAWKARGHGAATRFIELAGEINRAMPERVVERLALALDVECGIALSRARVLVLGLAYKKNVSDVRESPALELIRLMDARGTDVVFHDPHLPAIPPTRTWGALAGRRSVPLDAATVRAADAVLVATDHDAVDYGLVAREARLVVDTRNAFAGRRLSPAIYVKA